MLKKRIARFFGAAYTEKDLPLIQQQLPDLPIVLIAGKSNAGKSSLINHLCHGKNLAKVSSSPGKTESINFYIVGDTYVLVDLPGYGYARKPGATKAQWSRLIETFFKKAPIITLGIFLTDIRHVLSMEDKAFLSLVRHHHIFLQAVLTKADKCNVAERKKFFDRLENELLDWTSHPIPYSIHEPHGRNLLLKKIQERVQPSA